MTIIRFVLLDSGDLNTHVEIVLTRNSRLLLHRLNSCLEFSQLPILNGLKNTIKNITMTSFIVQSL